MNFQFQCPFCHHMLGMPPPATQVQVECPFCRQSFLVGASIQTMPVIQARPVQGKGTDAEKLARMKAWFAINGY